MCPSPRRDGAPLRSPLVRAARAPSLAVSAPAAAFAFERYKYEVLAVTGLVLYVLVYLWGRSANARILDSWFAPAG